MRQHGLAGYLVLGAVVLCITGGEALYADMGHFGKTPIRYAWYAVVFPALLLNYFGQGALYLTVGQVDNPFFAMVTGWMRYPLIAIATFAAVIGSQALISGAFSLTRQAVQLGFWPRVSIIHTSGSSEGQIYIPEINALLDGRLRRHHPRLPHLEQPRRRVRHRRHRDDGHHLGALLRGRPADVAVEPAQGASIVSLFLVVDIAFFGANVAKVADGGWLPLALGVGFFTVMVTWNTGRRILRETLQEKALDPVEYVRTLPSRISARIPGAGIFLSSVESGVPPVLQHQVERIHTLPDQVVLLTVLVEHVPVVAPENRVEVRRMHDHASRVVAHYGFTEKPDVPEIVGIALPRLGIECSLDEITYFVGHETFLATKAGRMGALPEGLFAFLSRNAWPASAHLCLPPKQVVELGSQIDL